jgi:transcriptional regulator with XRE-family HTH domain
MANERATSEPTGPCFVDNLPRLMGLHGLSSTFTATLVGVAPASLSAWLNGRASPSLHSAIALAELFRVPTDRLLATPFVDLLEHELSDRQRFLKVEATIKERQAARQAQ